MGTVILPRSAYPLQEHSRTHPQRASAVGGDHRLSPRQGDIAGADCAGV